MEDLTAEQLRALFAEAQPWLDWEVKHLEEYESQEHGLMTDVFQVTARREYYGTNPGVVSLLGRDILRRMGQSTIAKMAGFIEAAICRHIVESETRPLPREAAAVA